MLVSESSVSIQIDVTLLIKGSRKDWGTGFPTYALNGNKFRLLQGRTHFLVSCQTTKGLVSLRLFASDSHIKSKRKAISINLTLGNRVSSKEPPKKEHHASHAERSVSEKRKTPRSAELAVSRGGRIWHPETLVYTSTGAQSWLAGRAQGSSGYMLSDVHPGGGSRGRALWPACHTTPGHSG